MAQGDNVKERSVLVPITVVKKNVEHYLSLVENGQHIVITRYGKPYVVMVPVKDYEGYLSFTKAAQEIERKLKRKK